MRIGLSTVLTDWRKKERSQKTQVFGFVFNFHYPLWTLLTSALAATGVWGAGGRKGLAGVEGSVAHSLHPPVFYFFLF